MLADSLTSWMQSTQSIVNGSSILGENVIGFIIIGIFQSLSSILMVVGLIIGIIYMVTSKKLKEKEFLLEFFL